MSPVRNPDNEMVHEHAAKACLLPTFFGGQPDRFDGYMYPDCPPSLPIIEQGTTGAVRPLTPRRAAGSDGITAYVLRQPLP